MSDHDEQPEWSNFVWSYTPRGHACIVCATREATRAWAMGEHDVRPPDGALRQEIEMLMSAEDQERIRERMRRKQRFEELRRRRQDPDRPT